MHDLPVNEKIAIQDTTRGSKVEDIVELQDELKAEVYGLCGVAHYAYVGFISPHTEADQDIARSDRLLPRVVREKSAINIAPTASSAPLVETRTTPSMCVHVLGYHHRLKAILPLCPCARALTPAAHPSSAVLGSRKRRCPGAPGEHSQTEVSRSTRRA